MERLQVKAFSILTVLLFAVTTAGGSQCVSNYQELEKIFTESDENYGNLSEAFFVTNRINSRYVLVNYHTLQCGNQWLRNSNFTECAIVGAEQWIWSQSVIHILFHPSALNYLSLWYDDTDERMATVSLTLPGLCQNQKNKLLSRLTQLLKKYAESQAQLVFDDNDNLGRSYRTDEIYDKFNEARILCIFVSYITSVVVFLIGLQIVCKPKRKLGRALVNTKQANILYSFSLVWLIDIIWILYLDYTALIEHSPSEDIYSQKYTYFIVIADFITIALVLIITPFLCKETFFQRCCKLGNNYVLASKEYLVISTFMIFAMIHANHLVFILFGFLVEPIHGIANLIEFVTMVTYFISIFNIIFHYHRKYKDRRNQFLHYTKLGFKLMLFYLYFLILYFVFSYMLYEDLMVTEYHGFIKSISLSTLLWLVIISIHFSYHWSGTVGYSTTCTKTTSTTTTATITGKNNGNARKLTSRNRDIEQNITAGNHELRETTRSVVDCTPQESDYRPLIDTSAETSEV